MKTRRALQIIVGIISLLILLGLVAALVCIALAVFLPDKVAFIKPISDLLINGISVIAGYLGLAELWYIVPIVMLVVPGVLLIVATALLFSRDKGKQGKYVAASVFALIGIVISMGCTIAFATDLATAVEEHVWFPSPIEWTSTDMIVRYAAAGLLLVSVIFIGSALGVKPKRHVAAATDTSAAEQPTIAEQTPAAEESATSKPVYETVTPTATQQATDGGRATQYVPNDASVSDVSDGVYGKTEESDAATTDKISKARMLYEMGALTQAEYLKLVDFYLKK